MSSIVIAAAFIAFALFLLPGKHSRYTAVIGWACIITNLWLELPAFFVERNFLYPALALLSLPFLVVTVHRLLADDPVVLRLSLSAAVATLIYVPFALVFFLQEALVGIVITVVFSFVTVLGHMPVMYTWDVITENGFYNQIILGCTGIIAIALVTGIIAGVPGTSIARKCAVAAPVIVLLFFLNLFRVAGVFIAVSDRWFAGFPDPTGTGDANFFWAHNVVAEALAILVLLLLLAGLCRFLPELPAFARDTARIYYEDTRAILRR